MRPLLILLALLLCCQAEDPAPAHTGVRIVFLPPPMEGTLSLGIYNKAGKLVRTLKREATDVDFRAGQNGFITTWDGLQDDGSAAPAGSYRARGFCVGAVAIEGVAFHGNDWVTADSPRVVSVEEMLSSSDGRTILRVRLAGQKNGTELRTLTAEGALGAPVEKGDLQLEVKQRVDGAEWATRLGAELVPPGSRRLLISPTRVAAGAAEREVPGMAGILDAHLADDGTLWVAGSDSDGAVVRQYDEEGGILREHRPAEGEPRPVAVAALSQGHRLLLLEESPGVQRVRCLERSESPPPEGGEAVSIWKTVFSKTLRPTPTAEAAVNLLPPDFKPEPAMAIRLQPNSLLRDAVETVTVQTSVDATGSLLRTADGLVLCTIAEGPHLLWAVCGRRKGTGFAVFQSDGAVVEEFRLEQLAQIMAFDAGEYEWRGAAR